MKKQQIFPFFFFVSFTSPSIDNQQRKKKDRFFLLLLLSFFRLRMRGRRRRGSQDDKREAAFRTKPSLIILKVRSSSEERSNFTSPRRVVRCFRSQRSPPFLSSSSNVMKWEKKKYIRARASWKNENTCNRTSLGDDLVVVVWINVHRGRHIWWRE